MKITPEDTRWPKRLEGLKGMPPCLYVRGEIPDEEEKTIAIVGARMCSQYGKQQAFRFAKEMARAGVSVVSGMALGVDGYAHAGALEGGGRTYAVLGCGLDICYPEKNRRLYEEIPKRGGLITEFSSGSKPLGKHFPLRNRIISALADLVLVVEARAKSGSLITADFALEQGKDVYALPGRVGDALSEGCNRLIAQGAGIAVEPSALLEELGISANHRVLENGKRKLAKEEQKMIGEMKKGSHTLEELHQATGYPIPELSSLLVRMQLDGLIVEEGKNIYFYRE